MKLFQQCCEVKEPTDVKETDRGSWSNKWDYLLSLLGMTIGLGNVWRFPYLCYKNGGGAFLIPYVTMMFLIGVPLFFLETSIGQFSSATVLKLYNFCPAFRGSAVCSIMVTFIATTYYAVLVAYPLVFLWHSLTTGSLPYASCDNYWNTPNCFSFTDRNLSLINNSTLTSPSVEFFNNKVLQISSSISDIGGPVLGVNIANIVTWAVIFVSIFKGVKVLGKVVWFTAVFPVVMLIFLLIRGLTLPGASAGLYVYLVPSWDSLLNVQVWGDAAVQIFFSSGIGWGSLHCLGSYNRYNNNCLKDAFVVPLVNGITSFTAGLVAFSVLGFMSLNLNIPIQDLAVSGPELAFVAYPAAIAMMPAAPFWAVCFFAMLFFLGIDSCFVQTETVVVSITDHWPTLRPKKTLLTFLVCLAIYLGSLIVCTNSGMYWLQMLDQFSASYGIIFAALTEIIALSFIYGAGNVVKDLQIMLDRPLSIYWIISWLCTCPILLMFIFGYLTSAIASEGAEKTISWENVLGIILAVVPVMAVPVCWIHSVIKAEGNNLIQKCITSHKPSPNWGPATDDHRNKWLESRKCFYPSKFSFCQPHEISPRLTIAQTCAK